MQCKNCDNQMDMRVERIVYPIVSTTYYWCHTCGAFLTVITKAHEDPCETWEYPIIVQNANSKEKEEMYQMDMDSFRMG